MTEQEYIDVSDLRCIMNAISCLKEICPESSKIIRKKEYDNIRFTLSKWQQKLLDSVNIKES